MESPLGTLGPQLSLSPKWSGAGAKWKEPHLLAGRVSCVLIPAGPSPSGLFWNRCCVPLTSDPKTLGVLGCLQHGESSGDCLLSSCSMWPGAGANQNEPQPPISYVLSKCFISVSHFSFHFIHDDFHRSELVLTYNAICTFILYYFTYDPITIDKIT